MKHSFTWKRKATQYAHNTLKCNNSSSLSQPTVSLVSLSGRCSFLTRLLSLFLGGVFRVLFTSNFLLSVSLFFLFVFYYLQRMFVILLWVCGSWRVDHFHTVLCSISAWVKLQQLSTYRHTF